MNLALKKTLFAVLIVFILLAAFPLWLHARAADEYVAENVPMNISGVQCMVDFLIGGTASIWRVDNPAEPIEWTIPEALDYEGESYTVTRLGLSTSSSGANITALTLPDTLTDLGYTPFGVFSNVTELTIPGGVTVLNASFQNMKNLERLVISEGVEEIATGSMVNRCERLTEIILPDSLKRITGTATFRGATALETIDLPEGVVIEEGSTFSGCTSLKSVTLPASVSKITSSMFEDCTALTSVTSEGTITEVGSSAFSDCAMLTSVPSLDNVTKIGSYAFCRCHNLSGSPDLSKLTEVGSHAFEECYNLSGTLDLSSLQSIPTYAFAYYGYFAGGIDKLILGSGLESIGNWAFTFTTTDEDVVLPDGIESIATGAFYSSVLGSGRLSIPDSVTSLGEQAFEYTNLTELYIGSGLENIPSSAFAGCPITKVTINNSSDAVIVSDGAFPEDAVVEYTVPSIGNVGENISGGGQNIHDAVAAGGTVKLDKDVKLAETLTIPSGQSVTLTSDGAFTLTSDNGLANLIVIEKGATLTLEGNLTLSARFVSGSAIVCRGTLNLTDSVSIRNAVLNAQSTAVIDVSGDTAKAVISGGSVEENKLSGGYSAPVRVSGGAKLEMTGGKILNNSLNGLENTSSSGVLVYEGGSFTMTGGCIEQNSGLRGSGVMVYSNSKTAPASFVMSGGSISGNSSSGSSSGVYQPSGAVHVEGYASFTLKGSGVISNNSVPGGMGGGVCAVDPGIQRGEEGCGTAFTMTGGEISGNSARTGGGVYSYTNGVRLEAGIITGNTAGNLGGGVYSEGNTSYYSTLNMENALITDNTATYQGGGLWFCATGETTIHAADGAAIFGNSASEAGADFTFTSNGEGAHTATLSGSMLGGGSVGWYRDGSIYLLPGGSFYPSVDGSVPRYGQEGADTSPVTVEGANVSLALKAVASEEAQAYARTQAKLFITGNKAGYGGGVGANGGVTIGSKGETKSLTVTKEWSGDQASFRPDSIEVELKSGNTVIDRVELSADGGWTYTFTGLDAGGSYTVNEVPVPGYTSSVDGSAAQDSFTITNTFTPDTVLIRPADITVYMGGEHGYGGVMDGNSIVASDSLPIPGFIVTLPESLSGVPLNELRLVYEHGSTSCSWELTKYGPGEHNVYRIDPAEGTEMMEIRMLFTNSAGSPVTDDEFELRRYINQELDMKVYGEGIDKNYVCLRYKGVDFPISLSNDAKVLVRGAYPDAAYGEVVLPGESVPKGEPGVAAPSSTVYTINDSLVQVANTSGIALLFDDVIEANATSLLTNTQLMKARTNDELAGSKVLSGTGLRHYELKYIDLVDRNNGNAWVKASKPVTVYWPLPGGTDENTKFVLLRFEGLDREMSVDDAADDILGCEVTDVTITNDGKHISFTIDAGGFSPYVLVWETPSLPGVPVVPQQPDYKPNWLNTTDHYAYIIGYEDGSVRPSASITRAEVATIFFRLLTDESREEFWCETNGYSDVPHAAWYNNAVSTLSSMGILGGYEDGTFRPNSPITRAEFAKIAVSFFEYKDINAENIFTDVAEGSWYESFVAAAAKLGLIEGYAGNVYHPDDYITRAEACTIINRTLGRAPDEDHLLPESQMNIWPDNRPGAWYYAQVQEATNSHDYRWSGETEIWTEKLPERDWDALQH